MLLVRKDIKWNQNKPMETTLTLHYATSASWKKSNPKLTVQLLFKAGELLFKFIANCLSNSKRLGNSEFLLYYVSSQIYYISPFACHLVLLLQKRQKAININIRLTTFISFKAIFSLYAINKIQTFFERLKYKFNYLTKKFHKNL